MKKKFLIAIGVAGLSIASAKTKAYSIELFEPAMLGSTALPPGEYRVEVDGDKAVVRNGKLHGEAPVKIENTDTKYSTTTVQFANSDGKMHIQEIHVGGSKTKLVFNE